ncbi:MAG: ComF family protein [Porticoccaceae bacterium]
MKSHLDGVQNDGRGTIFPSLCCLCRDVIRSPNYCLCDLCIGNLPWIKNHCPQCGISFQPNQLCSQCQISPPPFRRCVAAFEYQHGSIDQLILAIKTNPSCPEVKQLSALLVRVIEQAYQGVAMPEIVIPVPLHWRTMLKRGFNQTDGIAIALARHFNSLKIDNNLCLRQSYSSPQHLKTKKQRINDMHNAFAIRPARHSSSKKTSLSLPVLDNKTIAIIDDVVTTGATASALASVLTDAGAKYVDVWALARTSWHI